MALKFTAHATRRMSERNIPKEWIEATIAEPNRQAPDPNKPWLMRAYERLPQAGGRVLRVVYSKKGDDDVLIITAFFDRDAG